MLRWFVPIVTILVLVGRSVTVFAAAGPQIDISCCCPDPKTCHCHDHPEGKGTTMKRCSGAEHDVSPDLASITLPVSPASIAVARTTHVIAHVAPAIPDDRTTEPEKPPF